MRPQAIKPSDQQATRLAASRGDVDVIGTLTTRSTTIDVLHLLQDVGRFTLGQPHRDLDPHGEQAEGGKHKKAEEENSVNVYVIERH